MEPQSTDINFKGNALQSDSDISDSKIIFDVNQLHTMELPSINNQKQSKSDTIIKPNILKKRSTSHSEQTISPTSECYECFYLSDSNNREESIIDEKKYKQMDGIITNDHFQHNKNILSPLEKQNEKQNEKQSVISYKLNGNSVHSDNEDNCFYLFNDYKDASDDEYETNIKPKYKINVPTITIPKLKTELLKQTRPAFILHLEMIDNDGSIKRQIIEHFMCCKRNKKKKARKVKQRQRHTTDKCDKSINKKKGKGYGRKYVQLKEIWKDKFAFKRNMYNVLKLYNVLNYFIFENSCDDLDMKINVDYFQH